LSGRGVCDELITLPEESYRLWCVFVCDLENLKNEEAMTRVGSQRHKKNSAIRAGIAQSEQRLGNELDDMDFESRQAKKAFFSPNRTERLRGPASLLFNGY
jgi:hypothetical protein